jgi:hypothetical protein
MKYTPMIVVFAIALMVIAGIAVDGAGKTQTVQQSLTIAEGAARAGTNAATGNAVNGDAFTLSSVAAANAANNYIATSGATGDAIVRDNQVIVTVKMTYTTKILGIIGISTLPAQASAAARLVDRN